MKQDLYDINEGFLLDFFNWLKKIVGKILDSGKSSARKYKIDKFIIEKKDLLNKDLEIFIKKKIEEFKNIQAKNVGDNPENIKKKQQLITEFKINLDKEIETFVKKFTKNVYKYIKLDLKRRYPDDENLDLKIAEIKLYWDQIALTTKWDISNDLKNVKVYSEQDLAVKAKDNKKEQDDLKRRQDKIDKVKKDRNIKDDDLEDKEEDSVEETSDVAFTNTLNSIFGDEVSNDKTKVEAIEKITREALYKSAIKIRKSYIKDPEDFISIEKYKDEDKDKLKKQKLKEIDEFANNIKDLNNKNIINDITDFSINSDDNKEEFIKGIKELFKDGKINDIVIDDFGNIIDDFIFNKENAKIIAKPKSPNELLERLSTLDFNDDYFDKLPLGDESLIEKNYFVFYKVVKRFKNINIFSNNIKSINESINEKFHGKSENLTKILKFINSGVDQNSRIFLLEFILTQRDKINKKLTDSSKESALLKDLAETPNYNIGNSLINLLYLYIYLLKELSVIRGDISGYY